MSNDSLTVHMLDGMAKDTGCSLHNDCLTCPFPRCRYDEHSHSEAMLRHLKIREMVKTMSKVEVARQLGISKETVYYALKKEL